MAIFKGSGVAIVTPFHEDETVNYEKLDELLEWQIAEGTDAIIICGTTGESSCLSEREHLDVIRHCVETVNGRIPVIAGTGSNCTHTAIEMSKEADACGVDGLLVVTPYYNKATQKGLIRHYTRIAEAVTKPIIMYNVPSRTGCNIAPATAAWLAKNVENIRGVKAASGDLTQIARTMQLAEGALDVYSGNDDQVIPIMSLGGLGVISVLANIAPRYSHEMTWKALEGNFAEAAKMQLDSVPMVDALFCEVNPIPVKTALNIMGKNAGPFRGPMCEMEPKNEEVLRQAMKDFGIEAVC